MEELFNDVEWSDHAINFFFMCTFVNWVRVYIEDDTSSMIDFVDWLLKKLGKRKKKASFYFSHFIQIDYCIDINT